MPQIEVRIGGRAFEVTCQDGEEPYLRTAAAHLDAEASTLSSQIGRIPGERMLLMAGLMIADRTASLEDKLRETEARCEELERRLRSQVPVEVRVEVPVVPPEVARLFDDLAVEAEALRRSVASLAAEPQLAVG